MIISAAVKILLKKENREVIIPCHRHGDAYKILKDLGFQPSDFETVKQGFIAYVVDPDKRINWIEIDKVLNERKLIMDCLNIVEKSEII